MIFISNSFPIRSTGFILEGFPNTAEEADLLADSGFFPDAGLFLRASDDDVITRLLPAKIARWREKRDLRVEHRRAVRELKTSRRTAAIDRRRTVLLRERNSRKQERLVVYSILIFM